MATIQSRSGPAYNVRGYSLPGITPESHMTLQFQTNSHVVQEVPRTVPRFEFRQPKMSDSQLSSGTTAEDAYQWLPAPRSIWLAGALRELAEVDDEIAEEGLPKINTAAKEEAGRIITDLAQHPWAPTVYPTQDGEIAIHFKSPGLPNAVVILLNDNEQADCYAYARGVSRRAHYDVSSDLPDSFVMEQLRGLIHARIANPEAAIGIGASTIMFLWGRPTTW